MSENDPLDPFDEPLRHLKRVAPPWASDASTVCGRPLSDVACWLPFEEAKALVTKVGQKRAQFLFCQTCLSRHQHRAASPMRWEREPARVVTAWAEKAGWTGNRDGGSIVAELLALGDLVAEHRDEYDALVQRRLVGDQLEARRSAKRYRKQAPR